MDATWFLLGVIVLVVIVGMIGLHLERKKAEEEHRSYLADHGYKQKEKK